MDVLAQSSNHTHTSWFRNNKFGGIGSIAGLTLLNDYWELIIHIRMFSHRLVRRCFVFRRLNCWEDSAASTFASEGLCRARLYTSEANWFYKWVIKFLKSTLRCVMMPLNYALVTSVNDVKMHPNMCNLDPYYSSQIQWQQPHTIIHKKCLKCKEKLAQNDIFTVYMNNSFDKSTMQLPVIASSTHGLFYL